ncbi:MAG: GMC oxidoreductase [Minisyncoccota bacterium]
MYDYCIIGSGPAGLTLANELKNTGKKICIIESGSKSINKEKNILKKVLSIGEIKIKEKSRERAWGGTSTTWAGLSTPFDSIDFEKWPIKFDDLKKYYEKLSEYGFAKLDNFKINKFDEVKKKGDLVLNLEKLEEKIFIASDPAVNFGKKYKNLLNESSIAVLTDTTVTKLNIENSFIKNVEVIDAENTKKEIKAEKFIICAGGLESTRLLLISNIGGGAVGKHLMNHPKNNFGILELNKSIKKLPYLFGYLESGFAQYVGLRIKENIQKEKGLLNSYIRFEPMYPWTDSRGVFALINLSKKAKTLLNWWKNKQKGVVNLKDYNETGDDNEKIESDLGIFKSVVYIISDFKVVSLYVLNRLQSKKEVSINKIRIRNFMEMEPSLNNQMTLSSELDIYGNPLPIVDLNTTELDRKSIIELHKLFKEEIEKNNLGKFVSNIENAKPWPINFDASHHLGGTIMGTDPNKSVVDTNLKVHSVDNLYICSGSVFPTAGCANPTYTICALALRLAEHLKY